MLPYSVLLFKQTVSSSCRVSIHSYWYDRTIVYVKIEKDRQKDSKKIDRKTETGKKQREGEVCLRNLKTAPSFLKLQVNILRIHELSLVVFINSL